MNDPSGVGYRRARVQPAGVRRGAGVVLVAGVAIIALSGGGTEREAVALDARCVEQWNEDDAALAYGRHNFNFHRYEAALVTHLNSAAEDVPAHDAGALCAVVFPSRVLDPEPFAAGEVFRDGAWVPISDLPGVELTRVAELQVAAAESPNAAIDRWGRLGGLPPEEMH